MKSEPLFANPCRLSWWSGYIFGGYSAESLGLFRIWFAFGMIFYNMSQVLFLFWIDPLGKAFYFTDPIWYFRLVGLHVHVPWVTYAAIATLFASTVTLGLGYRTRWSLVVLFISIAYVQGVRDSFDGDVHHRYVVPANAIIVFLFSRCGDVLSLDARRHRRQGRLLTPVEEWAASWPLRVIQIYVAFYYFFAAVAKLRIAGLAWVGDGGQVQIKLIERSMRYGLDEHGQAIRMKLAYLLAQTPGWLVAFVSIVILFELLSPLVLLTRSLRLRILFVICATAFHVFNFVLLSVVFLLYPFMLVVFFDLAKVADRLREYYGWKWLPASSRNPIAAIA